MPPVICHVLHSLHFGGAEVLAARLARNHVHRFRFVFACLDELGILGEELRREGFTVEVLQRRPGFDVRCIRKLSKFARAENVAVIHAHQYTPFFYCRAPGTLRLRPPVLFNEHGRFHPDRPNRKRMLFNRLFLRRRDRVVAVGQAVRQALIVNEGIPSRRIEVIYNGVPLAAFGSSEPLRQEVRGELGISPAARVGILVARLDTIKDHATALRVAQRVHTQCRDFHLVLVGDGPERGAIEQQLTDLAAGRYVRLLGARKDVPRLLAAADICLLTSVSEGIPVTLIEAMAAELPVVATDVGGVSEVVVDRETGLLAGSGEDEVLASHVLELCRDPSRAQALGQAGRRRAEQCFSEQQMHQAYERVYDEMISRSWSSQLN